MHGSGLAVAGAIPSPTILTLQWKVKEQHLPSMSEETLEGRHSSRINCSRLLDVAAHELAYSWQSTHAQQGQPAKIVEGFAEGIASRPLLLLGEQPSAARLTRRNDLYGEGLQYFIALERQQGQLGILQRASRM